MQKTLPKGWELKRLGDLVEFFYGYPFDSTKFNEEKRGFPLIRIRNLIDGKTQTYYDGDFDNNYVIKDGDILIGMDGEFNIVRWDGEKSLLNQRICKVEIKSNQLISGYAYRVLADILKKIEDRTPQVTVKHLSAKQLNSINIPLPPIDTQRKILAILEKTEAIKKFRTQTEELMNQLLQSVFLELFGDPIKNEKNWSLLKLKNVSKLVTVGIVVKPASYYVSEGVPALRGTNIRKNELKLDDVVYISEENNKTKLSKSIIRERDILIVRTGYPGTACIVPKELDGANCIDLIIVRPDENIIRSEYLCNFINYERVLKKILSSQTGSAQKHFNIGVAKKLVIPIPPIEIQNRFISIVKNIDTIRRNQMQSKQQIANCFNVLMQKAFTGELVA
jgi:type I restriction enzyme S subunit